MSEFSSSEVGEMESLKGLQGEVSKSDAQSPEDPILNYQSQAGLFLSMMGELAPQLSLDYSVESLQRLDQFITDCFEPLNTRHIEDSLPVGLGSYLGEVIIRHLGGQWNAEGKPYVEALGLPETIDPIEKAHKRFTHGRQDSLAWYYHALHKKLGEADMALEEAERSSAGEGSLLSKLGRWLCE